MNEAVAAPLRVWESFYIIVGSTAGALTGLQFVVMTLIAEAGAARGRKESIAAFGTPNVVHFCSALLVAAILSAPWTGLRQAGVAVTACGALGVIYSLIVTRRAHRQRGYEPVFEDWLWHTILPTLAYSTLLVTGAVLVRNSADALFFLGAAVLLLVFIGIHNAWDTVTYMTVQRDAAREGSAVAAGAKPRARAEAARGSNPGAGPAPVAGESPAPRTPGPSS